jgi:hypothetical protein
MSRTRGNTVLIVIIVLAVIIGIGAIWYAAQPSRDTGTPEPAATSSAQTKDREPQTIKVTYTTDGFVPPTIVIEKGDALVLKNKSQGLLTPESASPNTPDAFAEDASTLKRDEAYRYTVSATGTWSYRNAEAPAHTWRVRVE